MPKILKASPLIEERIRQLQDQCKALKANSCTPTLKVVLVGDNPASTIYTRRKQKFCERIGLSCEIISWPADLSEEKFLSGVRQLAGEPQVHGLLIQLPLPAHLQHISVGTLIPPEKDVDGFHPYNLYELLSTRFGGKSDSDPKSKSLALVPCTPQGIVELLLYHQIKLAGKEVVIIGRSVIVGKTLALLLLRHNATVTICHSYTQDLKQHTQRADIIVCAIGQARFLQAHHLSPHKRPVVVDVGINRDREGRSCGDVDYDEVADRSEAITPVPGGIGPMTVFCLAQNLLRATQWQKTHQLKIPL